MSEFDLENVLAPFLPNSSDRFLVILVVDVMPDRGCGDCESEFLGKHFLNLWNFIERRDPVKKFNEMIAGQFMGTLNTDLRRVRSRDVGLGILVVR